MASRATPGPKPKEGPRDSNGRLVQGVDMGPKERRRHGGGLVVENFNEQEGSAPVAKRRMRAAFECALDLLLAAGALGNAKLEETQERYKAAQWLRELHLKLHPSIPVMKFDNDGGHVKLQSGWEGWSEWKRWNMKVLNDEIKALGPNAYAVMKLCCDDCATVDTRQLRAGLDVLALRRGFRRQSERFHQMPVDGQPGI